MRVAPRGHKLHETAIVRMAGMRPIVLFDSRSAAYCDCLLSAIGCPSSQIAIDKLAAVPLWKVIVGPRAGKL
jgi:hypothetical protein